VRLNDPFRGAMPSLPADVYQGLKADIALNGVTCPIVIDEDNNILDGHHRYRAASELGINFDVKVEAGIGSDVEKRLRIWALNINQRQLSSSEKKALERQQKAAALELLASGRGLREVARLVGRNVSTIYGWRGVRVEQEPQVPENSKADDALTLPAQPESKVTPTQLKATAVDLASKGLVAADIARRIGMSAGTVRDWIRNPEKATKKAKGGRPPAAIDDDVRDLHEQGMSTNDIAKELGFAPGTVTAAKKRLGIDKRSALVRNPLLNITQRAETDAAVWRNIVDLALGAAQMASPEQVAQLVAELDRLSSSVALLKNRLKKEAATKEKVNGPEIREARH
jgi:transposase